MPIGPQVKDIIRPARALCDALARICSATASSELSLIGNRRPPVPVARSPDRP